MKIRKFIPLVFLLLCITQLTAQHLRVQESIAFRSKILNRDIKYTVILPPNYDKSGKSYPAMYMLHGLGDNESSWLEYGRVPQILDQLTNQKRIQPFICILPQGFKSYYSDVYDGSFNYQQMFVKELVPFIDSVYRTIAAPAQRAVAGYSMGGFGALVLPLKYPEIFGTSISLSTSIRTDYQYSTEDQEGWNEQWGRIFDGKGKSGIARITDYYKQNSPYYLIQNKDIKELRKVAFYIENGDKENTLCRSNEFLHQLLFEKNIPHVYTVNEGGHEFRFWRNALSNAFRFADARFRNIKYMPETTSPLKLNSVFPKDFYSVDADTAGCKFRVIYPENPKSFSRLYPVIYFVSDLSVEQQNTLINIYRDLFKKTALPPVLFCFIPAQSADKLSMVIAQMDDSGKARSGWRFRAVWSYGHGGNSVLKHLFTSDSFAVGAFSASDISIGGQEIGTLLAAQPWLRERLWLYIDAPAFDKSYQANSWLHISLRDAGFNHEFRARSNTSTYETLIAGFEPIISYISKKFHN